MSSSFEIKIPGSSPIISELIHHFNSLPGIGPKTAQRLAFHLMRMPKSDVESFAQTMLSVKSNTLFCTNCQNITESNPCTICNNPKRDSSRICVVEDPLDVIALERANCYEGKYHVLHGVISPMNGITPEDIKIKELLEQIKTNTLTEIIIATNPTVEGEATAMYIQKIISPFDIKISRLARGLPSGGILEYADEDTITRAFIGREDFD